MLSYTVAEAEAQIVEWVRSGLNSEWTDDENAVSVIVEAEVRLPKGAEGFQANVRTYAFGDGKKAAIVDWNHLGHVSRIDYIQAGQNAAQSLRAAMYPEAKEK
ncbi:hypothetical protein E6R60_26960 [Streptomyces sp. A0642]|uniref:hypothetical protein n=1 Tax=Streptomyces sp. A0642 TaxID=2563100 RepID=UPI0010A26C13|nr:hypothetical protein [Streptomyces sp. A0642]THA72572.1 hypothetical protein E6R60_26960 [Streptomyces sp. A0642]